VLGRSSPTGPTRYTRGIVEPDRRAAGTSDRADARADARGRPRARPLRLACIPHKRIYYVLRSAATAVNVSGVVQLLRVCVTGVGSRTAGSAGTLLRCARRPPTPRTAHASREPGNVSSYSLLVRAASLPTRYALRYIASCCDSFPHATAPGACCFAQAPSRLRRALAWSAHTLCSPKRPASRGPTHTPNRTRALTSHTCPQPCTLSVVATSQAPVAHATFFAPGTLIPCAPKARSIRSSRLRLFVSWKDPWSASCT
jgi:hypothetical protein